MSKPDINQWSHLKLRAMKLCLRELDEFVDTASKNQKNRMQANPLFFFELLCEKFHPCFMANSEPRQYWPDKLHSDLMDLFRHKAEVRLRPRQTGPDWLLLGSKALTDSISTQIMSDKTEWDKVQFKGMKIPPPPCSGENTAYQSLIPHSMSSNGPWGHSDLTLPGNKRPASPMHDLEQSSVTRHRHSIEVPALLNINEGREDNCVEVATGAAMISEATTSEAATIQGGNEPREDENTRASALDTTHEPRDDDKLKTMMSSLFEGLQELSQEAFDSSSEMGKQDAAPLPRSPVSKSVWRAICGYDSESSLERTSSSELLHVHIAVYIFHLLFLGNNDGGAWELPRGVKEEIEKVESLRNRAGFRCVMGWDEFRAHTYFLEESGKSF